MKMKENEICIIWYNLISEKISLQTANRHMLIFENVAILTVCVLFVYISLGSKEEILVWKFEKSNDSPADVNDDYTETMIKTIQSKHLGTLQK